MRKLLHTGLVTTMANDRNAGSAVPRARTLHEEKPWLRSMLDIVVAPTPAPAPQPACRYEFPDPARADREGLLARGGDLEPATLLAAYRRGIFPWPYDEQALLWWSPDPRAVLPLESLHVSRRLARTLRQGGFHLTLNAAFAAVIGGCAAREQTWITPAMREAYVRLHGLGWAHSLEVWAADGTLAGGLYGLAVGGLFAAESMFHRVRDASKVAVVALVEHARRVGITLLDVQVPSPHLASLGARAIPRAEYLRRLAAALGRSVAFAA